MLSTNKNGFVPIWLGFKNVGKFLDETIAVSARRFVYLVDTKGKGVVRLPVNTWGLSIINI